ncbi:unnamed protein product [Rotaria sordida]|uniref:Nicastrin small lobe domain-containing protein n=2 Tax=Rotaria sordida TaxID=392033 RepID=A0A814Q0H2_9BILA|nr:unnamed protein product [Rotaria sordida]CAF0913863.1 unnamed protein product [Rotaria sordida]CAF1112783.1 unnamed protein product [Rotaria sordida]CAF3538193.1 unnamed protein product [Rotaria sordida]CAF3547394.1 unnamed protein product [Rotaria sordida]
MDFLCGITRQSILDLGRRRKDLTVNEREITMNELLEAYQDNRLLNMFGADTFSQPKHVVDQIIYTFDHAYYSVRYLNGTHEIGCQSTVRGNCGPIYTIENDQDFNSYLIDTKIIDSSSSFIIVLNANLFERSFYTIN